MVLVGKLDQVVNRHKWLAEQMSTGTVPPEEFAKLSKEYVSTGIFAKRESVVKNEFWIVRFTEFVSSLALKSCTPSFNLEKRSVDSLNP